MTKMRELVDDLEARRERLRGMGGAERIERQHSRGKLTARERLDRFFDGGRWTEMGIHGTAMGSGNEDESKKPPADGVICAYGQVDGRPVCAAAYDFTVKGGSIGFTGEIKVGRMREMALKFRCPMVWFVDSAGARIDPQGAHQDMIAMFAGTGALFHEQVRMSGVVPQVAAMVGPGAAGTAYVPGLADFVPMVKDIGSMALAGPALVKAATGQEIGEQDLGGSKVHCEVSGVGDVEVESDDACIATVRDYLSYLPSSCHDQPPVAPCDDPVDRRDESVLELLPDDTRRPWDMYSLISRIVDEGRILDIKPRFGRSLITCFARIGGRPVGIVANQPKYMGGALDVDSADKAARFMTICDAYNVPLVFLQDVPGFMVGKHVEHQGIIRHGAKMLHVMSSATVPKITVVVRKAYGAGYYAMCGRAFEPDLIVAWPTAEISVMGAEGMLSIAGRKMWGDAEPPPEVREQVLDMIRGNINAYKSAGWGLIDDVIDPRDTRRVIHEGLVMAQHKQVERPARRRAIMPV
jgi:methylmalonyl-CoA decarboxylase subunit alpha